MEKLETGKDKIKKICEILKNETLAPAQEEAQNIVRAAQEEAEHLIRQAKERSESLIQESQRAIEKERQIFQTSVQRALQQAMESLRQEIESSLFQKNLVEMIQKETVDPKVGAALITALVQAIQKEGTSADFSAAIASSLPPEKINALLAKEILESLREKSVQVGKFIGGVQIKLHDKKITLDLSDTALAELLSRYLRQDFRKLLFAS